MARRTIIVIGGSTGSAAVLSRLVAALPADLPASLFVTAHLPSGWPSSLAVMLARTARLPGGRAADGEPIEPGRIYVAPPDRHLLLASGSILLGTGPRENMVRPSIDAMFRSAALAYGGQAVGVVLTGLLNDGAAGLYAIKARGGLAIVQDPLDAEADAMPRAALDAVDADYVVAADQLAELIGTVAGSPAGPAPLADDALRLEVAIAAGERLGSTQLERIADPCPLTCPDCGGVLSEVRGARPLRFRCQIGHAHSGETLCARNDALGDAIRVAMRIVEERVTLVNRMARDARDAGRLAVAALYESRTEEYRGYASTLRNAAIAALRDGEPHSENKR